MTVPCAHDPFGPNSLVIEHDIVGDAARIRCRRCGLVAGIADGGHVNPPSPRPNLAASDAMLRGLNRSLDATLRAIKGKP
jgi:hypothetical protein